MIPDLSPRIAAELACAQAVNLPEPERADFIHGAFLTLSGEAKRLVLDGLIDSMPEAITSEEITAAFDAAERCGGAVAITYGAGSPPDKPKAKPKKTRPKKDKTQVIHIPGKGWIFLVALALLLYGFARGYSAAIAEQDAKIKEVARQASAAVRLAHSANINADNARRIAKYAPVLPDVRWAK